MTASTRLDRLYPGLSLDERLAALLDAYHEGRPYDRQLLRTLPERDGPGWNRFVDLLDATHVHLGWYIDYVEATVVQAELRLGLLLGFRLAALLSTSHFYDLFLDPGKEERRDFLRRQRDAMDARANELVPVVAGELALRWLDVRLAEEAAARLGDGCMGRDILHPDSRATLSAARERLLTIRETIASWCEIELPEPEPEQVERLVALLTPGCQG